LRVLCGYDRKLCAEVLEAFVLELSRSLKRRAKQSLGLETVAHRRGLCPRQPPGPSLTGAVSVIQRGDASLRLNVHFHVLALDGVYLREKPDAALMFHTLPAPSADEVADVATRTALRVQKILVRHGRSLDGTGERDAHDAQPAEQLALSACYGAAASGLGLDGDRAGQPLLRIVEPSLARDAEPVADIISWGSTGAKPPCVGFNVHAQVAIPARDRARLERLCRYVCRPPIAQDRLEEHATGKLRYTFKKPWRDGTVALVLEPLDLIARVCALVPPPRFHMVRYHGLLSSHAKLRSEIVPQPDGPISSPRAVQLELFGDNQNIDNEPRRKPWAWLLRHVFGEDLARCPHCAGPMRWLEAATKPDAIAKLMAKHGLGPRPPPQDRAPPGQLRLAFPKT
jgi:hypothetical protein